MRQFNSYITIFFLLFSTLIFSQETTTSWNGYFSYLNIVDVYQHNNKIYAASENAIFIYDSQLNILKTIDTTNGLVGENISSIYYSDAYDYMVVGYENGLIQLVANPNQETIINDDVITVINILEKQTIPPSQKKINHFYEHGDLVFIATDYGISEYNLQNLEFGDTFFIGSGGSQINVNQTTVFNNQIYAATQFGVFNADVNSTDLINYNLWQPALVAGNWVGIQTINDKLFALRTNKRLYEIVNDNFTSVKIYSDNVVDLKSSNNSLIVTTKKESFVYDSNLNDLNYLTTNNDFNTTFTCGTSDLQNNLFVGTKGKVNQGKVGFGILKVSPNDSENIEEIYPNGPLYNRFFSIETTEDNLWAVFGGYSIYFGFNGGVRRTGISNFKNNEWRNIKYDTIKASYTNTDYLGHISINPFSTSNIFVSSYFSGLLEIKESDENDNLEITERYDKDNSSLEAFANAFELITDTTFDKDGNLWVTNSRIDNGLNKYSNGIWKTFSFESIITPPTSNLGYSSILTDDQNNVYLGTSSYGVIAFKEEGDLGTIKNIASPDRNMPDPFVTALAIDKRNQLWVGTFKGLRIIYNPERLLTDDDAQATSIIINENGLAQELLFQQHVTDIEVDGSNNKWISTTDVGVFYVSEDGQQTIRHFTKDNSPLPSNTVLDIAIDPANGRVYFATIKGLVSFESGSSKPIENIENAYVFPNPVRPGFDFVEKKIKIKDISENVNIKITDISGNLIAEAESKTNSRNRGYNLEIDGGTAFWNGKTLAGTKVSSGVYLVMLTDLDSLETKVLKLMVVR